jgi:hypothetical protein
MCGLPDSSMRAAHLLVYHSCSEPGSRELTVHNPELSVKGLRYTIDSGPEHRDLFRAGFFARKENN